MAGRGLLAGGVLLLLLAGAGAAPSSPQDNGEERLLHGVATWSEDASGDKGTQAHLRRTSVHTCKTESKLLDQINYQPKHKPRINQTAVDLNPNRFRFQPRTPFSLLCDY
jgi:hypothetical protein